MSNLFDYLEWRGDIPFSSDPFNEVDNLLLCELAYIDYQDIVPPDSAEIPIREVCKIYCEKHTDEEIAEMAGVVRNSSLLLKETVKSHRFRDLTMSNYFNEIDPDRGIQISAVTFSLGDGTAYAAFRGTDGTVVGWKEDLDFTFLNETPGQRRAVQYLNEIQVMGLLRVGGHSKGGNLALYAAAFCEDQERIIEVYTNDSPGFRKEIMDKEGYLRILPKVIRIIPNESVVGLLLNSKVPYRVIKSSAAGIRQHDGFTWSVIRDRFERAELSRISMMVEDTLSGWLERTDDTEREAFIDGIFSLLEATGKDNFRDIKDHKLKSTESILSAILSMPRERRLEGLHIMKNLGGSGRQTLMAYLNSHSEQNEEEEEEEEEETK